MRPRFSSWRRFHSSKLVQAWIRNVYGLGSTTADLTMDRGCFKCHDLEQFHTNAGQFNIGSDTLTVDLSSYAVSGASSLTLVDYANAGVLTTTFASETITGTGGWVVLPSVLIHLAMLAIWKKGNTSLIIVPVQTLRCSCTCQSHLQRLCSASEALP